MPEPFPAECSPEVDCPAFQQAQRAEEQIPTRFLRKFMRSSRGAATRRRIMSLSSHSLCFLRVSRLFFLVGFDRFKGHVQNFQHSLILRTVG